MSNFVVTLVLFIGLYVAYRLQQADWKNWIMLLQPLIHSDCLTDWRLRRRAKRLRHSAIQVIPESEWADFRMDIDLVARKFVPMLLKERRDLKKQMAQLKSITVLPELRELGEDEKVFRAKAEWSHVRLKESWRKNQEQMNLCFAFLEYLQTDLYIARQRENPRKEMEASFAEFNRLLEK